MKNYVFQISVLFIFVMLLTACPYSSKVPIDKPSLKTDANLIGKWIKASEKSKDNPEFYEFQKADDLKYNIIKNKYSSSDSSYTKTNYVGYMSKIEAILFLNMQKDGEGDYYIHKLEISGDKEFKLFEVTDNIDEKFNTSEELKAFIMKNMKLSFFYNKDEIKYIKK